jgi:hypothetical protein
MSKNKIIFFDFSEKFIKKFQKLKFFILIIFFFWIYFIKNKETITQSKKIAEADSS